MVCNRSLYTEPGDFTYFQKYDNKIEYISDNAKQKKQNHPTLHALATIYLYAVELHINPCFRQHTCQRGRWAECYWSEPGGSKAKSNWKRFCVQRIRKREHGCNRTGWAIDGYKLNAARKVQSCSARKCVLSFLMSIPTRIESLMLAIMLINTPVFKDNTCILC